MFELLKSILKNLLTDVLSLQNKAVAVGVVAFIEQAIPGVNLDPTLLAADLVAVGVVAHVIQQLFVKKA